SKIRKVSSYRKKAASAGTINELTAEEEQLFIAISFGKVHRVISLLPDMDSLHIRGTESRTPLIHAAVSTRGDLCCHLVRLLVKHGSDVNAHDRYGRTALMYVCQNSDTTDAVRMLVRSQHSNLNLQDNEGNTALMVAVQHRQLEAVLIMLFFHHPDVKTDVNIGTGQETRLSTWLSQPARQSVAGFWSRKLTQTQRRWWTSTA
ncbi:hypothetical protein BaRGS_00009501, partial [Batillaria attramentaria]